MINGWKTRGVPAGRYQDIAAVFVWTVDRLVNGPTEWLEASANDAQAVYSPMAMDIACMLDEIADEQQKRRAYALIVQILVIGNAPPSRARESEVSKN